MLSGGSGTRVISQCTTQRLSNDEKKTCVPDSPLHHFKGHYHRARLLPRICCLKVFLVEAGQALFIDVGLIQKLIYLISWTLRTLATTRRLSTLYLVLSYLYLAVFLISEHKTKLPLIMKNVSLNSAVTFCYSRTHDWCKRQSTT